MNHLFALLISTLTTINVAAQNWVEIEMDSAWGKYFVPSQVIFLNDTDVYIGGGSAWYEPDFSPSQWYSAGFLKSSDKGATWDTLHYFNDSQVYGSDFAFRNFKNQLFVVKGIEASHYGVGWPQHRRPRCIDMALYSVESDRDMGDLLHYINYYSTNYYLSNYMPIDTDRLLIVRERTLPYPTYYNESFLAIHTMDSTLTDSIELPILMEDVHDFHFFNNQAGFLVGGSMYTRLNGGLLYTADGGFTWDVILQAQFGQLYTIEFFDDVHGVIGGKDGLLFTENKGFDWYPAIGIPSRFTPVDASATDNGVGYVIGTYLDYFSGYDKTEHVQIYKTLDYGQEWCLVYDDTAFVKNELSLDKALFIDFVSSDTGVAVFPFSRILRTTNGAGITECVTSVKETIDPRTLSIFPNPSSGTFSVSLPSHVQMEHLSIFDLAGKEVLAMQPTGNTASISGLPNGVYLVKVMDSNAQMYVQRLVVAN